MKGSGKVRVGADDRRWSANAGNRPHSQMVDVGAYKRRKCLAALPARLERSTKKWWMGVSVGRVEGREVLMWLPC